MTVHCSKRLKNFSYGTTIIAYFLSIGSAKNLKIAIWLFSTTNSNALMIA